jgi:hypothetical protein
VWVKALSPLGIGAGATVPLALIAIAVFSGALALLMRNQPGGVWWWAATIVSPPVMLVVERGNTDLVVFAALVIAALALERPALAAASWLATVVLKLFTVAAAPVLLLHARPRRWMLAALGVAVAYAALSFRDIRVIAHVVPQDVDNSYGSSLLPARIAGSLEPANYKIIGWVIAGLVGIGALVRGWRHNFRAENGGVAEFQVAASIFIATYLVGVSFDYREIFLLLALPFTLRNPSVETRLLQVLIVASMWLGPGGRIGGLADDVVELVLFAVLVSLLTATFARTFRASTDGIRLRAR